MESAPALARAIESVLRMLASATDVLVDHGASGQLLAWGADFVAEGPRFQNIHADGLGSIVAMTDAAGNVTSRRQYDAWGNLEVGADQPGYAFTGREWDPETGLYYYRARYYDPKVGRFLSEDPIGFAGGINLYAYVGNNPIGWVDPTGWLPSCQCNLMQKRYRDIFKAMGEHLGIDPTFIMASAAQESGWAMVHVYETNSSSGGKPLNNLFGTTFGGKNNIPYPSIDASAAAWEKTYGPWLSGHPKTIEEYGQAMRKYNANPKYPDFLKDRYEQLMGLAEKCGPLF